MTDRFGLFLDNPILTKHIRSRLRPSLFLPWAVVTLVLCLCVVYGGYVLGQLGGGGPLGFILFIQAVLLIFAGAQQIASSVGSARETGILDFHRVSPTPPLWNALGFFLGGPIREYALFAITVPFALFLGVVGATGWGGVLAAELGVILGAWNFHGLALVNNLSTKKPKAGGRGFIPLIVAGWFGFQALLGLGMSGALPARLGAGNVAFFGLEMPWLLFAVLAEIPVLFFLLLPSVRKMRSEREHLYTKRQAVACMATMAFLVLGLSWTFRGAAYTTIILLYVLVGLGVVLGATITPNQSEYLRGVRRAMHGGRRRPSPWSDAGVNRIGVGLLGAVVLVAATIAWEAIEGRVDGRGSYSLTIAIGVLVVLYMGYGLQTALLTYPKRGTSYFALFVFFVWAVPIMIGVVLGAAGVEEGRAYAVLGISPLAGIVLSSGVIPDLDDATNPARVAAIAPAVAFLVLFYFRLEQVQRKLDRQVRASLPAPKELDPWSERDEGAAKTQPAEVAGEL